jgi:hypothetical protein
MGEAKRRKAKGDSFVPLSSESYADFWTPETGTKLAALCGSDVRFEEISVLGWLIVVGQIAASDHAAMINVLRSAQRMRTAPQHWPKLMEAAVLASQDRVFIARATKLSDTMRMLQAE